MNTVRLRVHIAPVGFEIDRIIVPAINMRADKVWLIGHSNLSEDKARPFLEKIRKTLAKKKAAELSIGQQQRVAAARAFIGAPQLIIADEPTSSLDEAVQSKFMDQLFLQHRENGSTLIVVSHDSRITRYFDSVTRLEEIVAWKIRR